MFSKYQSYFLYSVMLPLLRRTRKLHVKHIGSFSEEVRCSKHDAGLASSSETICQKEEGRRGMLKLQGEEGKVQRVYAVQAMHQYDELYISK